ncbi:MAG: acyloxyacyl hydrolase [Pseudomonadaceae bacterium]|nr:MAG: acyloxyacyl hydrolase [Pseudomonadaceae bacterium]
MKNKAVVIGSAALAAMLLSPVSAALDGLSVDLGHSSESTTTLRLGAQWDFGQTLWRSQGGDLALDGYWDLAATHWGSLDTASIDASPVFRLNFAAGDQGAQAYFEAGIGIAWFSRSRLAPGTNLGSSLQFADRIGLGLRLANGNDVGLRFFHYSNAGFNRRNSGVETLALHYRFNL